MKTIPHYKVAIIGAGPAGSSCAIALLRAGLQDIALINAPQKGRFHIGESIPPDMNRIFNDLGIQERFLKQGHEPCYGSCSYWGSELRGYNDTILSPYGHGWHLDRMKFNEFMKREATALGAKLFDDYVFEATDPQENSHVLRLKDMNGELHRINADVVVDASGTRSVFSQTQGSVKINDLPLICLGLRFKGKGALNVPRHTHLESVEHGWWYATRIPNDHLLVTFYTNAATSKSLGLQKLEKWIQLLQASAQTSQWVRRLEPIDQKLLGFSAPSFCLDTIVGKNWLAIGDAASTYDPITANGITKSVTHGRRAAQAISADARGNMGTFALFEAEVRTQHQRYLEMRQHFYNLEQRWPHSLFWNAMHSMRKEMRREPVV